MTGDPPTSSSLLFEDPDLVAPRVEDWLPASSESSAYDTPADPGPPPSEPSRPHHAPQQGWNAAALLNPRGFAPASQPRTPAPNGFSPLTAPPPLTFEFSSAGGGPYQSNGHAHPRPHGMPTDVDEAVPVGKPNNIGAMIERNYGLQDRSAVRSPKRRKVDANGEAISQSTFHGGSGGILADGIKEQQKNPASLETVDLTAGRAGPSILPRALSNPCAAGGDDDVVLIEKPFDQEACFGMLENAHVICNRIPSPKPGIQALGGPNYWPLVKIVLRRQVNDNTNNIQVYDHTRQVFGRIDPNSAAGLAALLDMPDLRLRTEARIPSRRKMPGEVAGLPLRPSQSLKIELTLYGRSKYARGAAKYLADRSLFLAKPLRIESGIPYINPLGPRPAPALLAQTSRLPERYVAPAPQVSRTVEEIRSDVIGIFDNMTKSEDLPEMEPNDRIQTELLQHQKQALYFMTHREKPLSEQANEKMAPSIWQKQLAPNNQTVYYNVVTGQSERQRPPDTLGGILADMMGLGKTLSVLSLIAATLEDGEKWASQPPIQPRAPPEKKKGPHPARDFEAPVPASFDLTKLKKNGRGTLLVCPLSTITNWEEQIKQHVKAGALTYHIYHGQNRCKDVDVLSDMDIVITTYGSVASELTLRKKGKSGSFPLEEIGWFRVVLDEAHMIREQSTLQYKAICRLQANRRWAVTGTPVQNRLDDLGSLLAFLRLKPFEERTKFVNHIVTPFKVADPEIIPKLRVLVDTITLRRKKDKINLPGREELTVRLNFSKEEQHLYDLFAKSASDRLTALTGRRERVLGGKTYMHILQSILRLRLICAHGKDLLNDEDFASVSGTTVDFAISVDDDDEDRPALTEDKAYQMFDLMLETGNDLCINCKRKLGTNDDADLRSERQEDLLGYMTPCFHVYCPDCISHFKDEQLGFSYTSGSAGTCPICEQPVRFSVVDLRHGRADAEHEGHVNAKAVAAKGGKVVRLDGYTGPHTKTQALVGYLLQSKAESEAQPDEAPIKSVVFSGWTSHLDLIELALNKVGIKYCRLDGKMTRIARTQAMETFREDPSVHVILVSIMAGGLGLNLTAGNNVFVMEPQFNPAAEAQAVDRVHRLGQKRDVRIIRFIMNGSFEENMLEIQAKKIQLANLSMDRTQRIDKAEAARQRLQDLRSLFR